MTYRGKIKKKRLELWLDNPYCRNCGEVTILPEQLGLGTYEPIPYNCATIQHKYNRLDPNRQKPNNNNEERWLLWCHICNDLDNMVLNLEYNGTIKKVRKLEQKYLMTMAYNILLNFRMFNAFKYLSKSIDESTTRIPER